MSSDSFNKVLVFIVSGDSQHGMGSVRGQRLPGLYTHRVRPGAGHLLYQPWQTAVSLVEIILIVETNVTSSANKDLIAEQIS